MIPTSILTPSLSRLRRGILCSILAGGAVLPGGPLLAAEAQSAQPYTIDSGPLATALTAFAARAGVTVQFDPGLTRGLESGGLDGRYSVDSALATLLSGSGLTVVDQGNGVYTLVRSDNTSLRPLEVSADHYANQSAGTGAYTFEGSSFGRGLGERQNVPQSGSVVTRAQIEDQNLTTLREVMQRVTGVTVEDYGAGAAQFLSRGFAIDTVSIDGVATGSTGNGTHGVGAPDMALYDRVEVLRGPAGLLQGAGEPGGGINLARKRALADTTRQFNSSVDSWGGYRLEADLSGALSQDGALRGRAVTVYEELDSFIDDIDSRKTVLYGTIEYDLAPTTTVSVGGSATRADRVPYVGWPVGPDGEFGDFKRSTNLGSDWNSKEERPKHLFIELEHLFANGGEAKINLSRRTGDFDYKLNYTTTTIDPETNEVGRIALNRGGSRDDLALDAYLNQPFRLMDREHSVLVGVSGRKNESDLYTGVNYDYPPVNVYDPVRDLPLPEFEYGPRSKSETKQYGLYSRTNLAVTDSTTLVLGGRLSHWETGPDSTHEEKGQFTPYAGVIQSLQPDLSVYASFAEIFQPQTATDRDGKVLEPRVGNQFELGIKGQLNQGRLDYSAALFRIIDENRAIADALIEDASVAGGKVRSQGLEAELSGRPLPGVDVVIGYAYTDTELLEDADENAEGKPFAPGTPEHSLKLWGQYGFAGGSLNGLTLGAGMEYSSGIHTERDGARYEQGSYATLSARAAYQIEPGTTVSLTGTNLTDRHYYSRIIGGGRQNYFGDPSQLVLALRTQF
ncbi:TonB-dependent siderophore receptor [Marinobacter sp. CA1]|uniref:TonB-dependent siderophore receptor n=1 Tax=Marinobacter sp. CA1 TaxID=2817656 RepID=UPI001D06A10D|nr:TonB-dependent receptor [Marinobacter sp. CA1]UDL03419.1 TonB-dependent siderophore receptor [Marinobacter sp. CA1]